MLLYLSLLGFLLSGILLFYNKKKFPSSAYLAIFFLLVSLYRLNEYVILYSKSIFWNAVISSNFIFLSYLIGPFLFFYVRSVVFVKSKLTKVDVFHFVPALLFFFALIPYYSTSFDYKLDIARKIVEDPGFLGGFKPTIFSDILTVKGVYLSRPSSILGYTIFSIGLLLKGITSKGAYLELDSLVKKWLVILLSVTLVSFIIHFGSIVYMFGNESSILFIEGEWMLKLAWISFTLLIISPLLFPRILYSINVSDSTELENGSVYITPKKDDDSKTLSIIDKEYYNQIGILIADYFLENKTFIKSGYNLTQLSNEIGLPVHHLAFYFREVKCQSFNDYKNELRVNYACELLKSDKFNDMTLEAIGEKAGFSSRTTFIRAFKKATNQTPANFKALNS